MPATTKFLAIGEFTAAATPDQLDAHMNQEVTATLKLYLDGKMDQFWLRLDGKGVVFVMTTETSQKRRIFSGLFRSARSICFALR